MQLTSGSGELTFHEAAFRFNKEKKNLSLPTQQHYTTGISKPANYICGE
jgi:hypothetical protein